MEKKKNLQTDPVRNHKFPSGGIMNFQRRDFLKYSLLVGGGFLVGKFFDSVMGLFLAKENTILKGFGPVFPQREQREQGVLFENLAVQETEKEVIFHDRRDGYKILEIEK